MKSAVTKAATPWGAAALVEELTLPQRAGEKRFASVVQLLETTKGERLRTALADRPALKEALML